MSILPQVNPELIGPDRAASTLKCRPMNDADLPVYVDPLAITVLKEPLPVNVSKQPGDVALMLLGEVLGDQGDPLAAMRKRCADLSDQSQEPHIVPLHDTIIWHIVRPLREAKQCYVLGMPVASIAQSGLVGEMVALWRFRMLHPQLDGRPLNEELQKLLFGREFDKLGQEERVRVLRALDQIEDETIQAFGELRFIRKQYLHFMVEEQKDVDADARRAMRCANTLVVNTLSASAPDGKIVLPARVIRYIQDIVSIPTNIQVETSDITKVKQ